MKKLLLMMFGCIMLVLMFPFIGTIRNRQKRLANSYRKDPKSISDQEAHGILKDLAWKEYYDENFEKALTYSNELLRLNEIVEKNWNYGNAIHHSHSIIGLVSLELEDLSKAKKHLLLSSKTPGSPQLNSYGPTFLLAHKLLELNEHATVKKYLLNCRKFWETENGKIANWLEEISAGTKPDFKIRTKI